MNICVTLSSVKILTVFNYYPELVNVVSRVPLGSVLGQLMFLLYTSELFSILENKLQGDADISTLVAVVPSQPVCVAVADSPHRMLNRVSE